MVNSDHYSSGNSEKKEEPVGNYDRLAVRVDAISMQEADSGLIYTFEGLTQTNDSIASIRDCCQTRRVRCWSTF